MNLQDIDQAVVDILANEYDDETQFNIELGVQEDFIKHLATNCNDPEIVAMAKAILAVGEINFSRCTS